MNKKDDKDKKDEKEDLTSIENLGKFEHPEDMTPPETELTIAEEFDLKELNQEVPEVPPELPETNDINIPEVSSPEASLANLADLPESSETPETSDLPDLPELPDIPEAPSEEVSEIPEIHEGIKDDDLSAPSSSSFSIEDMVQETMQGIATPTPPPVPPTDSLNTHKAESITLSFKDIQEFGENIAYGDIDVLSETGGPHFSVLVKNILYEEDAKAIFKILSDHNLTQGKEDLYKKSLEKGHIIISHINEYSAIFLAHKLRRFEADIGIGYSAEIHPSKIYESKKGLNYKRSLVQNKTESINLLSSQELSEENIILSTAASIDGKKIHQYLGIISDSLILSADDMMNMDEAYSKLSLKLRPKALSLKGNAIIGVSFQLHPLANEEYKLICTGSLVWIM